MENLKVKCERCGLIKDLFQYTKFEAKIVETVKDNGEGAKLRYTAHTEDIGEKRGLCEDCAVFVNKMNYDAKHFTI